VQRTTGGGLDIRAPEYGSEQQVHLASSRVDLPAQLVAAHCPEGVLDPHLRIGEPPHLSSIGHRWRTATAEDRTRRAAERLFADSCGPCADSDASTSR
jgi:hypothetical protein